MIITRRERMDNSDGTEKRRKEGRWKKNENESNRRQHAEEMIEWKIDKASGMNLRSENKT